MKSPAYLLMEHFNHSNSVEILFGENIYPNLPSRIKGHYRKILFVCPDKNLHSHDSVEKIKDTLIQSGFIISKVLTVSQNSIMSTVSLGVKRCIHNNIDCIIAIGGASAINVAKLIALESKSVTGSLPVITIPTSFSSSAITNYALILDENTKQNHYFKCDFPFLSIIDPTLIDTSCVKFVMKNVIHILNHVFDFCFNSSNENEFKNYYAELLIQRIMSATENILQNPHNLKVKDDLMWCALISSVIFPREKQGTVHKSA